MSQWGKLDKDTLWYCLAQLYLFRTGLLWHTSPTSPQLIHPLAYTWAKTFLLYDWCGEILLVFRCTIDGICLKPLYIMKAHPVPQYALSYKPPRLQYLIQTISQNPPPCNPLPLIDPRRLTSSTKPNSTSCNCMVFVLQRTGFVLHITYTGSYLL